MHTAHLLTISQHALWPWGVPAWGYLPRGYLPRGVYLPGSVPAWGCTCVGGTCWGLPARGYLGVYLTRGVYLLGGACLGNLPAWGVYLPGGVPAWGIYLPGETCPGTAPPIDRQTPLKTLPSQTLFVGGNNGINNWGYIQHHGVRRLSRRVWATSTRKSTVYSCTMWCESWTITFPKEQVKCLFCW